MQVDEVIQKAVDYAQRRQYPEGFWSGPFLGSELGTTADLVIFSHCLGMPLYLEDDIAVLLSRQRPDGGWERYYGAPLGDISETIKNYVALKLLGHQDSQPYMQAALRFMQAHGGVAAAGFFTQFTLALLGLCPWDLIPPILPEIMLLPRYLPGAVDKVEYAAQHLLVPGMVLSEAQPVFPVPFSLDIGLPAKLPFWLRLARAYQNMKGRPGRKRALDACAAWIAAHQNPMGGWRGNIYATLYNTLALSLDPQAYGQPLARARDILAKNRLKVPLLTDGVTWDTAWMLRALMECRVSVTHPMISQGVAWLLHKQLRGTANDLAGDDYPNQGGWSFEYSNNFLPDCDDTAIAMQALIQYGAHHDPIRPALQAALTFLRLRRSARGGWSAFRQHALIPSKFSLAKWLGLAQEAYDLSDDQIDTTINVLRAFKSSGTVVPDLERSLRFIWSQQAPDGSWLGRWGNHYIFGTFIVLEGLHFLGLPAQDGIKKGINWLLDHQQSDGGWGEHCAAFMGYPGVQPATASQTSWALMGLMPWLGRDHPAVRRGIAWLCSRQNDEGSWDEPYYTACGFRQHQARDQRAVVRGADYALSRSMMIRYDLYRHYWPMMALGRWRHAVQSAQTA